MPAKKFSQNMVGAFNEGKALAFLSFYDTYHPLVKLRVLLILRGMPDAEDLVNEIFYKMFKTGAAFQTKRNIEHYLWLTTNSMCRDFRERSKTPFDNMDAVVAYYQRMEENDVRRSEIRATAQTLHYMAMEMLPPQCKEVYILSHIRGLRNKEIARQLNISEKTVERHINIAHNRLRAKCRKDGGSMYFIRLLLPVLWDQLVSL